MARSQAQSDFVVYPTSPTAPSAPVEAVADGAEGAPRVGARDPEATVRSSEASAFATRWVMGLTWFVLLALVLLCVIGPHIPSGE